MQRLIYIVRSASTSHAPEHKMSLEECAVIEGLIEELIQTEHIKHIFFDPKRLSLDAVVDSLAAMITTEDADRDAALLPTIHPLLYIVPPFAVSALEEQVKRVSALTALVTRVNVYDGLTRVGKLAGFNGSLGVMLNLYTWLIDKMIYHQVTSRGGEHNLLLVEKHHELRDFYRSNSEFRVVDITLKYTAEGKLTYEIRAYNGQAPDGVDIPKYLAPVVQSTIDRVARTSSPVIQKQKQG